MPLTASIARAETTSRSAEQSSPPLVARTSLKSSQVPITITVKVPLRVRRQGGRKLIIAPAGATTEPAPGRRSDSVLIKALSRGFRWRNLIETHVHSTLTELAQAEKISASYVSRILRLTLLNPDIVDAILDGRQPREMTLTKLMQDWPLVWGEQQAYFEKDSCIRE